MRFEGKFCSIEILWHDLTAVKVRPGIKKNSRQANKNDQSQRPRFSRKASTVAQWLRHGEASCPVKDKTCVTVA